MSFTFYTPINDAGAVLAAPHLVGDGHLVLDDATLFAAANPSPTAPIRVCAGPAIFKVIGISGSTLLLDGTVEGTTDTPLPSGTVVEDRVTAGDIKDLQSAINSGTLAIGNTVSGGTTNYILFVDSSGKLGQSSDLQFIGTQLTVSKPVVVSYADALLQSTGSGNPSIAALSSTNSVYTKLQSVGSSQIGLVGTQSNHQFGIYTNNTSRAIFDTAGHFYFGGGVLYHYQISGSPQNTVFLGLTPTTLNNNDSVIYSVYTTQITGDVYVSNLSANATGYVMSRVTNSNTSSATAHAQFEAAVSGANSGDPKLLFTIAGVQNWALLADNSDADKLKLCAAALPGTNDVMTATVGGAVTFGPSSIANAALAVTNTADGVTGSTSAIGNYIAPTLKPYTGTSSYTQFISGTVDTASGNTLAHYGIRIDPASKTGSNTIATAYGLYVAAPTIGSTNVAGYFGGNVGIGTISPTFPLEVAKDTGSSAVARIGNTQGSAGIVPLAYLDGGANASGSGSYLGLRTGGASEIIRLGWINRSSTWGVEILNTSNTSLMRVDSFGNVGIGTTSPNARLDVSASGVNAKVLDLRSSQAQAVNNTVDLRFFVPSSGTTDPSTNENAFISKISAVSLNTGNFNGDLLFYTNSGSSLTEKMRLTGGGVLGLRTSSPRCVFEAVNGTPNTNADAVTDFSLVGPSYAFNTALQQANLIIASNDNQAIDKGGSLMFGGRYTDASTAQAHWSGIRGGKADGTSGNYGGYLVFGTRLLGQNVQERMRITDAGRVGVNEVSPGAQLQINASSASTKGLIVKAAASMTANIQEWQDSTGTVVASVLPAGGFIITGLVGINTTNPSAQLHTVIKDAITKGLVVRAAATLTKTVSNVALTSNVATITTSAAHGFVVGATVVISGLTNSVLNGTYTIASVPTTTTFTFAKTNADIASVADSGTAVVAATGNIQEWQSGAGAALGIVTAAGNLCVGSQTTQVVPARITCYEDNSQATFGVCRNSVSPNDNLGGVQWFSSVIQYPVASVTCVAGPSFIDSGNLIFSTRSSGSSQTERMRIDPNGNVGIGTVSPYTKAHISGGPLTITNGNPNVYTIAANALVLGQASQAAGDYSHLIRYWTSATPASNAVFFSMCNGSQTGHSDVLSVWGTGKVGINYTASATDPGAALQVNSAGASTTVVIVKGATSQVGTLQEWQDITGNAVAYVTNAGLLVANSIQCKGSTGQIGIGRRDNNNADWSLYSASGDLQFYNSGDKVIFQGSTGRVGINQASPGAQAHISSTTGGKGLIVDDTSSSPDNAIVSITRVNNISSPTTAKAALYVKDHANNYPVQVEDHAGTTLFQVKGDGTATSVKVTSKTVTNISIPDSTATTVFTLPGQGVWMVTFVMDSNSQSAYCLVGRGAVNNPAILQQGASGQVTFSLSGDNLQVTQTSSVTSTTNTVNILKLN